jgi:undecaprenyl-diphosphatase
MNILQSIALGLIQGFTEFIPVSSSGHLQLIPQIFGWEHPSTTFILFLHIGTLLALVLYFRNRIWRYIQVIFTWIKNRGQLEMKAQRADIDVIKRVIIAVIPAGVLGIIFDKVIGGFYDSTDNAIPTLVTICAMAMFGVIFLFADKLFTGKKVSTDKLSIFKVLFIGLSQALAFVRGVSRSGITLISGQAMGLSRVDAAEFSFLISIPIITGTSILAVVDFLQLPSEQMQSDLLPSILGMLAAFISGYLAIRFLLDYLKHKGLALFGWYRILFAIACVMLLS